jgi:hypothetical protein
MSSRVRVLAFKIFCWKYFLLNINMSVKMYTVYVFKFFKTYGKSRMLLHGILTHMYL